MYFKQYLEYYNAKVIRNFVHLLTNSVNLTMLEAARNKPLRSIMRTKEWNEALEKEIDNLIPKFTYRQWKIILSLDFKYEKLSKNKTEDIRLNLRKFLKLHYRDLYQNFNMKHYSEFQTKEKEDVKKLVFFENGIIGTRRTTGVLINYKDGRRMCYEAKTGNRLVIENVMLDEYSVLVVLHEKRLTWSLKLKLLFKQLFLN